MHSFVLTQVCFGDLAGRPDSEIDLAVASAMIAEDEFPDLKPSDVHDPLDELARRAPQLEGTPREKATALAHHLFVVEGFRGNEQEYYDPRNSFLNCVLDRRSGIPITLSVVLLEVARRLALPLVGIGFPRRFLVGIPGDADFFIDVFEKGRVLSADGARRLFLRLGAKSSQWSDEFLAPVNKKQILQRILRNLKEIYLHREDVPRCLAAAEKLAALEPGDLDEIRDRGVLSLHGGAWVRALADLETYLAGKPAADDAELIRTHCAVLRKHLAAIPAK